MKNYVRIFSLLLCVAMLLCILPAANAVTLEEGKMPQTAAFGYDEWLQAETFTEFSDLQQIVWTAKMNPDKYYKYEYVEVVEEFVFDKSIEIPSNVHIIFRAWVIIPANVTVKVQGYISTFDLDVQGKLHIGQTGEVEPRADLNVTGSVDVYGILALGQYHIITGLDRIRYLENGMTTVRCYFVNSEQLKEIADEASAAVLPWYYRALIPDEKAHLEEPVELPENMVIELKKVGTVMTGAPITINGNIVFEENATVQIQNDLILNGNCSIYSYNDDGSANVELEGNITNNGQMDIYSHVIFKNAVTNLNTINLWHDQGAVMNMEKPELYKDTDGEVRGKLCVNSKESSFPEAVFAGMVVDNFETIRQDTNCWTLSGYHVHMVVEDPAVDTTCLTPGKTAGSHCSDCGEVFVKQENLPPQGHDYGIDEDGNPDFWDTTCDVCGAERVVDKYRPTHSMYRMYNPNSGEHFYTGSMEERQNLEAAGWKYEGVGFTFPATTGKPVYRLYDRDNTKEHLYTMDEAEKDQLLAEGWILEGVAFNSGREDEVAQYRLHNPNATIGAYHFTASIEERDALIAAGWEDQGIGFYTCWQ